MLGTTFRGCLGGFSSPLHKSVSFPPACVALTWVTQISDSQANGSYFCLRSGNWDKDKVVYFDSRMWQPVTGLGLPTM